MVRLATYTNMTKWEEIATANSGKTPRHEYSTLNEDSSYDSKVVIRGTQIPPGGDTPQKTGSGFLENETGQLIGGVRNIPTSAPDTEPERTS